MTQVRIAVFDVDGTLIQDNVGVTFVKYLNARSRIKLIPKAIVAIGYGLYKARLLDFEAAIRLGCYALVGLSCAEVSRLADKCFDEKVKPRLYQMGIEEIQRLKQDNWMIVLATGAHKAIASKLADFLGADHLVCTESSVVNDIYGWSIMAPIPYKEGKKELVRRCITAVTDTNLPTVRVYTDEAKDLPLLDLGDECVGVNADDVIRSAVLDKGGRLAQFS